MLSLKVFWQVVRQLVYRVFDTDTGFILLMANQICTKTPLKVTTYFNKPKKGLAFRGQ